MNLKKYKSCAVPLCNNTTTKTPKKLFIYVPKKKTIRHTWLILARRDPLAVNLSTQLYFCEDHFDLPNDMENYMEYHVMGAVSQVRMKPGCVPLKFDCQPDRTIHSSNKMKRQLKIKRLRLIREFENDLKEKSVIMKKKIPMEITFENSDDVTTLGVDYASDHVKCDLQTVPFTEAANDFQTAAINVTEEDSNRCLQNVPQSSANIYNTIHDMDVNSFIEQKPIFDMRFNTDIKYCNDCKGEIVGFRYACVQCANYDLCVTCEARGAHAQHYALRVPAERPEEEIKTILEKIRKILEQEITLEEVHHIKVEADHESNTIIDDDCPVSRVMVKIEVHETDEELTPPIDEDTTYDLHRNAPKKDFEISGSKKRSRPNILKRPTHPARLKQSNSTQTSRRKKATQTCEPDIQVQIGADLINKPKRSKTISKPTHTSRTTRSKSNLEPSATNMEPIVETNKDSRMLIPVYMHNTEGLEPTDITTFQIQPDPLIRVPPSRVSEALCEDPLLDPSLAADPLLIKTESHD